MLAPLAAADATVTLNTYTAQLNYKDLGNGPTKVSSYGTVTIQELTTTALQVTVKLTNPAAGFVNTGGPHDPFLFSTNGDYDVAVTNSLVTVGKKQYQQSFTDGGHGSFEATPFGTFTDKIGCCNGNNGASNMSPGALVFTVSNNAGISFAGTGATFDANGKLTTLGSGAHFMSHTTNGGTWWFAADIVDGSTFNVAAADFVRTASVTFAPEPATWAMFISGFGLVGAAMRRQRRTTVSFG